MKNAAEELFENKYLPLLKQMYLVGYNDGLNGHFEKLLWLKSHKQKKQLINFGGNKIE